MDFLNTPEKRDRRLVHLPMGRFGEAVEVAKGALFCKYIHVPKVARPFLNCCMSIISGQRRQQLHDGMLFVFVTRSVVLLGIPHRVLTSRWTVV